MKATIRDLFTDTRGRRYEATWSFTADRPLTVELTITGGGDETTWVIDRSLLPWSLYSRGEVALGASGPRLIVILHPLTTRSLTLVGSLAAAEKFTAAAEQLEPHCPGCDVDGCACCAAVAVALDTELAWITRGTTPPQAPPEQHRHEKGETR